jgi:hypothetical protein
MNEEENEKIEKKERTGRETPDFFSFPPLSFASFLRKTK